MAGRWIKLWESIAEWEWYKESKTVHLFIHLLMKAQFKETNWCGYTIPRGCVVTSRMRLAQELGLTEREIRTSIGRLEKSKNIENVTEILTKKKRPHFTIYKVNNYDKFQASDQDIDQEATKKRPRSDQEATTYKKDKKERKTERKEINKEKSEKLRFSLVDCVDSFFNDPELKAAFMDFAEMKKRMKNPISTKRQFLLLANKLKELSKGQKEASLKIINQSIMNGWKGFYELKDQPKENLPEWYSRTEEEIVNPNALEEALEIQKQLNEKQEEKKDKKK